MSIILTKIHYNQRKSSEMHMADLFKTLAAAKLLTETKPVT